MGYSRRGVVSLSNRESSLAHTCRGSCAQRKDRRGAPRAPSLWHTWKHVSLLLMLLVHEHGLTCESAEWKTGNGSVGGRPACG